MNVSKPAGHNLEVTMYVVHYWKAASHDSKTVVDLVITNDLLETVQRQVELQDDWDKSSPSPRPNSR